LELDLLFLANLFKFLKLQVNALHVVNIAFKVSGAAAEIFLDALDFGHKLAVLGLDL
jgi:hypothetical protein